MPKSGNNKKRWRDNPKSIAEVVESLESLGFAVVNKKEITANIRAKLKEKKMSLRKRKK